jgi:2-polyprenyl-3-methyl-5-hydroxy-6-metoxy-1,4-benzoquinol methylase
VKQNPVSDLDSIGRKTLDLFADTDNFNRWMYEVVREHCSGKILEIGSGIGNISQYFINDKADIVLSDIRKEYLAHLKMRFPSIESIIQLDLENVRHENKSPHSIGQFDTIIALNVIEHIERDDLAILNCYNLLKPGGYFVMLVPAFPKLYNKFDRDLSHYRRYTKSGLREILTENHFDVIKISYFNFIGLIGWFLWGKLSSKHMLPEKPVHIYDKLVPLFKRVDYLFLNRVGLSLIAISRKNS